MRYEKQSGGLFFADWCAVGYRMPQALGRQAVQIAKQYASRHSDQISTAIMIRNGIVKAVLIFFKSLDL